VTFFAKVIAINCSWVVDVRWTFKGLILTWCTKHTKEHVLPRGQQSIDALIRRLVIVGLERLDEEHRARILQRCAPQFGLRCGALSIIALLVSLTLLTAFSAKPFSWVDPRLDKL
jgi:hypothetical protein